MDDIGGPGVLAASAYGREMLPDAGFAHRAAVHVRHDGRLAAVATVLRARGFPPFSEREVAFMQRVRPLIELACAGAVEPLPSLEHDALLPPRGSARARSRSPAWRRSGGPTRRSPAP